MKTLPILLLCGTVYISFCKSPDPLPSRHVQDSINQLKDSLFFTGPDTFLSYAQLEKWTKSSFGGGFVTKLSFAGQNVFIANRSWTSGTQSSEIGVYVAIDSSYFLIYSIPLQHAYHRYEIKDNRLVIIRADDYKQEKIVAALDSLSVCGHSKKQ